MQAANNSEVLQQIHEIGELLRLAQTPEGWRSGRLFSPTELNCRDCLRS